MNNKLPLFVIIPSIRWLHFWLPLLVLLLSGNAWGGNCTPPHDMDFSNCVSSPPPLCTYAVTSTTTGVNETIIVSGTTSAAAGSFNNIDPIGCSGSSPNITCLGLSVQIPSSSPPWDATNPTVTITGNVNQPDATVTEGSFDLNVTEGSDICARTYKIHVTSSGGGWGDPHITTVDGVHYDFQSAGEFIALKGDDIEIQTRQTAVSKQGVSATNPYTGIASCVSIYTAVATRVGKHRVTIQPNLSGEPDPSGVQIRVDGILRALGPDGIDLSSCDCPSAEIQSDGRIVRSTDEKSIEIHYANGTKLVVTPAWWESQEKWYMNVNVYDTTATKGIMGRTIDDWLPALFDGTSVGTKAADLHERYVQLYETFADSWRVGGEDKPSLFDYADDTSTDTFTLDDWPRENPSNCLIGDKPNEQIAKPVDQAVAEAHCSEVVDENNRANCIFDVRETGHTGFADAYERAEQIVPGATRTSLVQDKNTTKPGTTVTFTATVQRAVSTIGTVTSGVVQFVLDGKNAGDPVEFDPNGNAVWSTSSLPVGRHEVEAKFMPSGFGERFRPSSAKVTHVVSKPWWLSFHVGSTAPTGNFSDAYDRSYSAVLDLEYKKTTKFSYLGLLGYNHFEGAEKGIDDTYWVNLSANVKYYFLPFAKNMIMWVNGGAGAYLPKTGSTRAGANVGVGLGGRIVPQLRWELGVNYHNIFTSGSDTQFTVPTVGVTYNF